MKKPLKKRSKVKLKLQQHTKNLHLMEDISPLMAVTDLNLTVHPHLHLMNLTVHLHLHMAVMAKPTHHLHPRHLIHP